MGRSAGIRRKEKVHDVVEKHGEKKRKSPSANVLSRSESKNPEAIGGIANKKICSGKRKKPAQSSSTNRDSGSFKWGVAGGQKWQ